MLLSELLSEICQNMEPAVMLERAPRGPYRRDYLCNRRDGFQYKRAVPKPLQKLVGRATWTAWLGVQPRTLAAVKARALASEHDQLIARLSTLPEADRQQIVAAGGIDRWRLEHAHLEAGARFVALGGTLEPDPEQPEEWQAADALFALRARREATRMKTAVAAAQATASKLDGKPDETALTELVTLWQRIAKPRSAKSIDKMKMHVRRFAELVGDHAPRAVTRQHAMDYRDALEELPGLSATSVDKHLYGIHRLYNVALSEGRVDANPFIGVKARKGDNGKFVDDDQQPFTLQQAQLIFARYTELPIEDQIVIRLMAYHGARSKELCQLRACDVRNLGGVDYISINDAVGSVKNKPSVRDVPLHPKCRDLLKLAKSKAPGAYLFDYPMWKDGRQGKFQQRANAFVRRIGITDKKLSIHSWRHTWRTLARELNMPPPVSRAIMGHTLGKGEHEKYGEGPSLKLRAKWIAKVDPLKG